MGREVFCHNQWNTESDAPPSAGRQALSVVDQNISTSSQLTRGRITGAIPHLMYSQPVNCSAGGYIHSRGTAGARDAAAAAAAAQHQKRTAAAAVANHEAIPEQRSRGRPAPQTAPASQALHS